MPGGDDSPERQAGTSPTLPDLGDPVELGQLRNHVGYALRRAQLWIFADFTRTLATVPLTPAEYSVLLIIEANPGLQQSRVARTLGIERAGLVRLLDRLQENAWIERRSVPGDRRSHALHLSPAGTRTVAKAKRLAAQHEAHVVRRFGADRRNELLRLLHELGDEGW